MVFGLPKTADLGRSLRSAGSEELKVLKYRLWKGAVRFIIPVHDSNLPNVRLHVQLFFRTLAIDVRPERRVEL